MKKILMIIILLILALVSYKFFQSENNTSNATIDVPTDTSTATNSSSIDFNDIPPTYVDSDSPTTSVVEPVFNTQPATPSFTCDGRQHCSQMTSCAEATYFSNNCPNTKMDGNHDGVPCEQQWCN